MKCSSKHELAAKHGQSASDTSAKASKEGHNIISQAVNRTSRFCSLSCSYKRCNMKGCYQWRFSQMALRIWILKLLKQTCVSLVSRQILPRYPVFGSKFPRAANKKEIEFQFHWLPVSTWMRLHPCIGLILLTHMPSSVSFNIFAQSALKEVGGKRKENSRFPGLMHLTWQHTSIRFSIETHGSVCIH